MKPRVADASVVATAFFREEFEDAARSLLVSDEPLHAPDLIHAEIANVIWKRHGRNEIDEDEAVELLASILALPLRITPTGDLADAALRISLRIGRTAYDCLYVALAVKLDGVLVTADQRLVNSLAQGPLAEHVAWIGAHQ